MAGAAILEIRFPPKTIGFFPYVLSPSPMAQRFEA